MTTTETNQTKTVLRDLVARFTEHPEALEITAQVAPPDEQTHNWSCFWMMKGHPEDESKLVGKDGAHVRALEFLVSRFGVARLEVHTFRLITKRKPEPRPQAVPNTAMSYDPQPTADLLSRILAELDLGEFLVRVGPGSGARNKLTFLFEILVRDGLDQRILTVRADPNADETIVGAIGTLFRAIAQKDGVRFDIKVSEL